MFYHNIVMNIGMTRITKNKMLFLPKKVIDILDCRPDDYIIFMNEGGKVFLKTLKKDDLENMIQNE